MLAAVATTRPSWPSVAGGMNDLGGPTAGIISGDASALGISVSMIAVLMQLLQSLVPRGFTGTSRYTADNV